MLIHFADAPCHGSRFNDGGDSYPNPSSDMPWEDIFKELKTIGIDYYFMEINTYTRKMTQEFKQIWDRCGHYFRPDNRKIQFTVTPISTTGINFVGRITSSIMDSIERSNHYS